MNMKSYSAESIAQKTWSSCYGRTNLASPTTPPASLHMQVGVKLATRRGEGLGEPWCIQARWYEGVCDFGLPLWNTDYKTTLR